MTPLFVTVALVAALACAQDPTMGGPPKELKALGFMMGVFDTELTMSNPGQTETIQLKGTIRNVETLDGMWIESRHETDMGGMQRKGLQMISYDSATQEYVAVWFDSMGPGVIELRGTLKGQTLTMVSEPAESPSMPGKFSLRATTSMKGVGKVLFRVEMDSGQGWFTMLEAKMTWKPQQWSCKRSLKLRICSALVL